MDYNFLEIIAAIKGKKFDEFANTVKSGNLDVNLKDTQYGMTALSFAVETSDLDLVNKIKWIKLLVSLGADVNIKTNKGITPMLMAILKEDTEVMKCLAEAGVDINLRDNEDGKTLIFFAAQLGKTESIKCLVSLGADVNTKDNKGYTPIFSATKTEVIKCLVELGADVNAKMINGGTPAHMAVSQNNVEALKCLKSLGADINAKTSDGKTPLSMGIGFGDVPESVDWLKDNGGIQ